MKRSLASFLVFISVGVAITLSPAPKPKASQTAISPRPTLSEPIESVQSVAATPTPEPTPQPTPETTWRDNPQGCNEATQWIALEPPHDCIDKVEPESLPQQTDTTTPPVASVQSGNKYDWMRSAGIPEAVWTCADTLIIRESGWQVDARNPSSGALGIPQSLPGEKMASAGADYLTNPVTQLRWMQGYVNARYGGFCQALAHSDAKGWY